ncbi:MAG: protein kinase domain-containing protein [Kofleriaceae bacterium]
MARELLHYRIVGRLGEGAMGEVFHAIDSRLGRDVALKMLPKDAAANATSHAQLVREARAASALNHPGIVTLHDIEQVDDEAFIVMELVHGERFSDLAQKGMTWRRALELVANVGDALAYAHAREVLHRDIKADNLMLTPSGQTKVLDFGLAKLLAVPIAEPLEIEAPQRSSLERMEQSDLTQAGQLVGTPTYMAPECFEGKADARSDVWALAVVLFELLTGKRPFDRDGVIATMIAIQLDDAPAPSGIAPDRAIPEAVDAIVRRALAKQPADRFADMKTFVAEIRGALVVRAKWWPWIVAAAGGVGATIGITYALTRGSPSKEPIEIQIGAAQRITFDRGCEEYPRLHPDGKRIVYDGVIDGDYEIQVRDLGGGDPRRLTTSPGWDYAAAISPDGAWVAFVHEQPLGRTLHVVGIDGGAVRDLGAIAGYPAWTRDGALLVGDTNGQIVKRPLTGGETVLGRLPPGARLYHLVDGGSRIALMWWTSSEADATVLGELAPGGALRIVEQSSTDYEGGLATSPTGRGYYATQRAAAEGNQLLFRPWGGEKAIVVSGGISPGAGIDVARDGSRIVFSTCSERQYIARITGDTIDVISQGQWQDTNPRVLADGSVLVTSSRTRTMQGWLLPRTGSARAVTPNDALGAVPSPDGTQVVYAARGGRGGLAIVPIAGGTPRSLTTDASDASPTFTRDGTHVVFERTSAAGETAIHVVGVVGGEPRELAIGAQPATSLADDTIVYLSAADQSGARRVMRTSLAGGTPVVVASFEAAAWQRPRISADGTRIIVVRGFQQIVTTTFDGDTKVVWVAATNSVSVADFAPDGSIVAAVADYDGDLWIAEGKLP